MTKSSFKNVENTEDGELVPEIKHRYLTLDEIVNDHLQKATLQPPKDPENEDTLLPDLMIKKDWLIEVL